MKKWLTNNIGTKIISLLLALLIWLIILTIEDPVITVSITNIPVEVKHREVVEDQNQTFEITSGSTAEIRVRGKTSLVDKLTANDFKASADLKKLSRVDAVPIDIELKVPNKQIEIISDGSRNTMVVNIEDLISKDCQVRVVTNGSPLSGYTVGDKVADPNMITVSGPKTQISRIKEIVVEVDVMNLSSDITTTVTPKLKDNNGDDMDMKTIKMMTDSVNVSIDILKTKKVPIKLETEGSPLSGYAVRSFSYSPEEILIAGRQEALDAVEEIILDPVVISGENKEVSDTRTDISASLPEGIRLADSEFNLAYKVVIEPVESAELTVPYENIKFLNSNSQYEYKISGDNSSINVNYRAFKDIIEETDLSDVVATINVEDLGAGSHQLPVNIQFKTDVSSVKDVSVTVEISVKGTQE